MRKVDIVVGFFFACFGAYWIWQSSRFEFIDVVPGPGFLPMVLAVAIFGLSVLLVVTRLLGDDESFGTFKAPKLGELGRVGAVSGVIVVAALLIPVLGFLPTFVLLVATLLFGIERTFSVGAFLTVLVVPFAAYWLFGVMFGVRLPTGPLGV